MTSMDYIEIYQLYSAYSIALDTGNGPGRVATFTPDGTFSWFLSNHQPESMENVLERTSAYGRTDRPKNMFHILTNIHITPTPEGANGSCYAVLAYRDPKAAKEAKGSFIVQPGFYSDTLVKTTEGWRFKTREFWTVDEDEHLRDLQAYSHAPQTESFESVLKKEK